MATGKVWLIGAGPSDVGLLTLKAKRVLEQADVVVYDALVGQGILAMIPDTAELIDVGKRARHHKMHQYEINQVLLEEAKKGKRVVRLKGGDPFLFGRGGEELELLAQNQIPYEIVPGITSAISVPAYNGIPVTHRDFCSSLHIITGHKRQDAPLDIDFDALTRTKGTLVFLMGVTALEEICEGLLKAGMDPDMPAAMLQQGTTARQRRAVATISTLKAESERQKIAPPAIIVVGKVCGLADSFAWYEHLPLAGNKIVVTRPRDRISTISEKLRQKGAEVLELPAIRTIPIQGNEPLHQALRQLDQYQWLVFTSPAGVKIFFDEMKAEKTDIRRLGRMQIAAIGQGTKKEIEEKGIFVDLIPEVYDGKSLGTLVGQHCKPGDRILIPRARIGTKELTDEIGKQAGIQIDDIPIYDTVYETSRIIDERAEFEGGNIDFAVFTSASTVRGFAEATQGLDYSKVTAACIGKQTKAAADALRMNTYMAESATIESLVALAEEIAADRRKTQ